MNHVKTNCIRKKGVTLIELLTVLAVLAILVSWGVPSLRTLIQNNQVSAQNLELVTILQFAKSEAIRRNDDVPVILTASGNTWEAIVEDPAEETDVTGCEVGQLRCANYERVQMNLALPGGISELTFNNRGYIVNPDDPLVFANGVIFLQHESCNGNKQRKRIEITPTGQINSCSLACDDSSTECS